MIRKLLAGLALGLGAAGLVLLLAWTGVLDTPELWTYDWRIRQVRRSRRLSIKTSCSSSSTTRPFAISRRTLAAGRGRASSTRASSTYLNRAPAKVIAVDFAFLEPDGTLGAKIGDTTITAKESDAALVESVRQSHSVVLLADAVYQGTVERHQATAPAEWRTRSPKFHLGPAIEERPIVIPPFQELTDVAAALGHNRLAFDPDGGARRMAPFIRSGEHYMPSLGVAAALKALAARPEEVTLTGTSSIRVRDRAIPLVPVTVRDAVDSRRTHEQLTMMINYRAPALVKGSRPYPSYEARHLFESEQQLLRGEKPTVDPMVFKDKVVFLGLTASGLVDVFQSPFGSQGTMPGIQLHASIADSILSNRFIRQASDRSRVADDNSAARCWSV